MRNVGQQAGSSSSDKQTHRLLDFYDDNKEKTRLDSSWYELDPLFNVHFFSIGFFFLVC